LVSLLLISYCFPWPFCQSFYSFQLCPSNQVLGFDFFKNNNSDVRYENSNDDNNNNDNENSNDDDNNNDNENKNINKNNNIIDDDDDS